MTTAKEVFAKLKELGEGWRDAVKSLIKEEQAKFWAMKKAAYFCEENRQADKQRTEMSPSGKYRLVLDWYSTGPNSWNFSQGTIYAEGSESPIAVIQRNYGSFPFAWVEGHPNGHEYFVGGQDYQGQTVIELDTGVRRDLMSDGSDNGWGFCWAAYKYLPDHQLLEVDGCHWACPYEFRYYDFSDPMNGWPQLKVMEDEEESYIDSSEKKPTITADGLLTVYQVRDIYDTKEYYETEDVSNLIWEGEEPNDPDNDERFTVVATKTFKIQDKALVLQSTWVSDREKAYREEQKRRNEAYRAWEKEFTATDPLYLAFLEEMETSGLPCEKHLSRGFTYDNWCPGHKFEEARWCTRVEEKGKPTISIEWAIKTGPVKVTTYHDGKGKDTFFMEHSVESVRSAWAFAKAHYEGRAS